MAISTASKIQFEYMLGGGPPAMVTLPESSGQTFIPGAFLKLDSSGHTVKATSGTLATGTYLALQAGANSTADGVTEAPVLVIDSRTVMSGVVYHATTASAVVSSTQYGDRWPLIGATDSGDECWVISIASSGEGAWILKAKDATGTAYGRLYFLLSGISEVDSPWAATG